MKYLALLLFLGCQNDPEPMATMMVTAIDQIDGSSLCGYSLQGVSPYLPSKITYLEDQCGKYQIGQIIKL